MSQTMVAAREAETMRAAAAAAPAIGEDGEVLGGVADEESEEDDDAEASDEEVAAAQASPRSVMPSSPDLDGDHRMPRIGGLGDEVLDSADLVDEEPGVEEDDVDESYVLEEEDEELEKEEEEDEGLGPLGGGAEDYCVTCGPHPSGNAGCTRLSSQAANITIL